MARPREFDESRALVDAMGLFWERGYEATTMRDVAARAGIALSSLYATFASKHALYLAALAEYRRRERDEMERLLAAPRPVREAMAEVYGGLIASLMADAAHRGAFTLNAAVELGGQDEAVTNQLHQHFDDVCGLLASRLAAAQAAGQVSDRFPADDLARFLLFGLYGLAMMVKVYPDRENRERTAAVTLALLDK
jgi:TetR/AcrR family transcriptional repressor of nem operon